MTDRTYRTYRYRLVVKNKIAYESIIDSTRLNSALEWGFYWIPNDWVVCACTEPVHAEIRVDGNGQKRVWSCYQTSTMNDMQYLKNITNHDVMCLIAGQSLVWKVLDDSGNDATGRIFCDCRSAMDYIGILHRSGRYDLHVASLWVDGYCDEQFSWERKSVKGYELRDIEGDE